MFLYLATNGYNRPGQIVKVRKDLTRVGVLTLNKDEQHPYTLQLDGNYLFVGLRTKPGRIVRINKSPDIDCQVSVFDDWSVCTMTCKGGQHSRTRKVLIHPSEKGKACPVLSETQACNTQLCPVDCVVKSWLPWSVCNKLLGKRERTRPVEVKAAGAGQGNFGHLFRLLEQ